MSFLENATHEQTVAVFWVCSAAVLILMTAIISLACYRYQVKYEIEKTARAKAENDARIAVANEKITNGRDSDDFMATAKAIEMQAAAMERFVIAQEKLDAFMDRNEKWTKAAREMMS